MFVWIAENEDALIEKKSQNGAFVKRLMIAAAENVVVQAVKEGWGGDGERAGVSTGIDRKANTRAAHLREVTALPLSPSHSLVIPSAV